jgi:hypothetical protein
LLCATRRTHDRIDEAALRQERSFEEVENEFDLPCFYSFWKLRPSAGTAILAFPLSL